MSKNNEKSLVRAAIASISRGNAIGVKKNLREALFAKIRRAIQAEEKAIAKKFFNEQVLSEDTKAAFGTAGKMSYAIKLNSIDDNEFMKKSFAQQVPSIRAAREFMASAKKDYVDAKGKATLAAVKAWVKENKPSEFYSLWQMDSSFYKNDVVEIFYKD